MKKLALVAALLIACSDETRTGIISGHRSTGAEAGPGADGRSGGGAPEIEGGARLDAAPAVTTDGSGIGGAPNVTTDGSTVDGATRPALEITEVVCPEPTPLEPAKMPCDTPCGNGTIDSCQWTWGHSTQTIPEQCDGPIAAGSSCETSGYAGGALACTPFCQIDYSGCTSCQTNPEVLQCVERLDRSWSYAKAAGGGRIALGDNPAGEVFRFQQLDETLAPVAEARCWQLGGAGVAEGWTIGRLGAGWLLGAVVSVLGASSPNYEVRVFQLDDAGHVVGAARSWPNASRALMVSRESGGPLMLIYRDGSTDGVLFDATGAVVWDKPLPFDFVGTCNLPVFTADGFLVARSQSSGLDLAKFDLDGRLVATHPIDAGCPLLAWNGTEARMAWTVDSGTTGSVLLSRLDANGAPLGAPATVLTWSGSYSEPLGAMAAGKDTLLFFRDYRAARVDDSGAFLVQAFAFRTLPPMTPMSTLELGADVLVFSYESANGGGVGLTRFRR